jgi:tripeptidyl-peptidase-1
MKTAFLGTAIVAHAHAALQVVHVDEPSLAKPWTTIGDDVPTRVQLKVSLKEPENGVNFIREHLLRVSDPEKSFGEHLTTEEIKSLTAPSKADVETVTAFFKGAQCESKLEGSVLDLDCSTSSVSKLLSTTFRMLSDGQQKHPRAAGYRLPQSVADAVETVYGLHQLPLPVTKRGFASNATFPGAPPKVTPQVISSTYSISGVTPSSGSKNRQAVAEFQAMETISETDLSQFFQQYVPDAPAGSDKVTKFVGPTAGLGGAGIESSLDIQYIMGVAPGIQTEFWYMRNQAFCSDLKAFTQFILNSADSPKVYSISYGWQGPLSQLGCQQSDVKDVDKDFMKIAALGISIIFASGDSGAGVQGEKLWPSWPASSPWVTAVGATRFQGQRVGQPEMAVDQFGSGGGFSWSFIAFQDQKAGIKEFMSAASSYSKFPPSNVFNAGGRGTPDVAALGENFQLVINGRSMGVGGTSASAPTFAAMVSLMNEARIQAGKSTLGYLNPLLYKNEQAFNDVIKGNNAIGRGGQLYQYGYPAVKGWDAATGLGSVKFQELLKVAEGA